MSKVKNIGIILETKSDARKINLPISHLYHWREPEEIKLIKDTIKKIGFNPIILGTPKYFALNYAKYKIDFILNLSVGFMERYRLAAGPALYSLLEIPYSGADPYTKMISQHKHMMKSFWNKLNIPTPEWTYIHSVRDISTAEIPPFPVIIKPAYEGSSIGIGPDSVVSSRHRMIKKAKQLFDQFDMPLIVERFILGRECKVGIIGNKDIEFSAIIEDVKMNGLCMNDELLYFKAKTFGEYSKKPLNLRDPLSRRIMKDALKIYKLFLPMDYGTMDVRIDDQGRHYFLEFNADATLHPERTLVQCCALNNISFLKMMRTILAVSFKRWGIK